MAAFDVITLSHHCVSVQECCVTCCYLPHVAPGCKSFPFPGPVYIALSQAGVFIKVAKRSIRNGARWESLLLHTTNRKCYIAYQITAIPLTLSDLQGHSLTASLYICDFLYSCAAVDKISTDIPLCAVPLQ